MVIANPPLTESVSDIGGVKIKPPFEMGGADYGDSITEKGDLLKMKNSVGRKLAAIVGATVICMGISMTAVASGQIETCTHHKTIEQGETVYHWTDFHEFTFEEGKPPLVCNYMHWMDRIYTVCENCRITLYTVERHHETHDLCGRKY